MQSFLLLNAKFFVVECNIFVKPRINNFPVIVNIIFAAVSNVAYASAITIFSQNAQGFECAVSKSIPKTTCNTVGKITSVK